MDRGRRAGAVAALTGRRPPPAAVVELMVRALALPGGTPEALAASVHAAGGDAAAGARSMIDARRGRLDTATRDRCDGWAARALAAVRGGLHVLVPGYRGYPERLLDLDVPPPILFARGDLSLLDDPAVAVVGTRRCTQDGTRTAERIAAGVASAGAVVVSGLALGIDAAAHGAASPRRTIAVLGCGVDVIYPRANRALQEAIGREGLLVSERLPGTPPYPYLFPERNRIIAALSSAVVIVEAPARSGALITADCARVLGRPVFAAPGPLGVPAYEGSNSRIRDALAVLITGPEEVLKAIGVAVPSDLADLAPPELEGVGLALWRAVGAGAVHADDLAEAVGLEPGQGLASLLALEIQGHLRQLPGMRFVRRRTAEAGVGYHGT